MEWPEHLHGFLDEAAHSIRNATFEQERPFMLLRPRIFQDGDQWCALLGDNLQEGVCAFGDSPSKASYEWDKAWYASIPAKAEPNP